MKCKSCDREVGFGRTECWICYFSRVAVNGRIRSLVSKDFNSKKEVEHIIAEVANQDGEIVACELYERQNDAPLGVHRPWFKKVADFTSLGKCGDWLRKGFTVSTEHIMRSTKEKRIILHFFDRDPVECSEEDTAVLRNGKQYDVRDLMVNDVLATGQKITKVERLSVLLK